MGTESIAALIEHRTSASPKAVYLEDARSDRSWDYAALGRITREWRDYLGETVPAGRYVLLDVSDPLSFAAAHLSIIAAGRRSIPVNPDLGWSELEKLSELVDGVSLVVSDREEPGEMTGAALVRVDPLTGSPVASASASARSVIEKVSSAGAALLFTSGSTGVPKGVELGEQQLMFVARGIAAHNGLQPGDRGYNPLPLFHVNAEVVGLLATLVAGSTLVLDRRFHRTGFWELLRERRITWINSVPAMLAVLAHGGALEVPETVRFIRSASAPLPDAVRSALHGVSLVVSYGMTEGASQITATPLGELPRPGSVGIPVGCEVEARDEDGARLPAEAVGALWIRGPGIITSYFRGRVAERFDTDGWLSTGDLGKVDHDGYVYLVGRSDDVINRGGEKVYPSEVEDVLLEDGRVREAVVVARPDAILGQVPVAYVIPADADLGSEAIEALSADLLARCAQGLPRFKRPVEISVVDDVPRAPTGKVQRNRVRALAASE